jgi:uncharacterized protein YndB with AHSA1/START domain
VSDVVIERVVAAAPELAFRAWTEPEHVRRWWRPHGMGPTSVEIDLRPGGRYRIGMAGGDGEAVYVGGAFRELDPPHRLSYTWRWENGELAGTGESLVTVEFRAVPAGSRVTIRHELLADAARGAHEQGWSDCLDALGGVAAHAA